MSGGIETVEAARKPEDVRPRRAVRRIVPKEHHNYVAFFLTLACNLTCPYCITLHGGGSRYRQAKRDQLDTADWIRAADRLLLREDLPLTLQGGEPTLHPGFYRFVNDVRPGIRMDLLTNLTFDVDRFVREVPVWRFSRPAPYAPIRASYHPGQNDVEDLVDKTRKMQDRGFRVGIYGILHPDPDLQRHVRDVQKRCLKEGIDFRTKDFLGDYAGRQYGDVRYPGSVGSTRRRSCECRTTELIVDPGGYVYRCHSDLYNGRVPIGHILDNAFTEEQIDVFRPCDEYGSCNPCDVKVTTNRFQVFGHTSVEIRSLVESTREGANADV